MLTINSRKSVSLAAMAALTAGSLLAAAPAMAHNHKSKTADAHAGHAMQPNAVEAAVGTGMHNTLVAAVKAAGLVETLASPGPFTIFAPTDAAFAKLPAGTVDTLLMPENKGMLVNILTYHAVAGEVKAADLIALINKNNGSATLNTIAGATLTATLVDGNVTITDGAGRATLVTTADVDVSNGVIHVTDGVFLPA